MNAQVAENPNSTLTSQTQETSFVSRYSDPNHPASSGSLVALVTGGALVGGRNRREVLRERAGGGRGPRSKERGPLRRLLQQVCWPNSARRYFETYDMIGRMCCTL